MPIKRIASRRFVFESEVEGGREVAVGQGGKAS